MKKNYLQYTTLILTAVLSGCTLFAARPAATPPALDSTQAFQTVEARLTAAVALTQVSLPTETQTLVPVETPAATDTPAPTETAVPSATLPATVSCDQASPGSPVDVTIPDDTEMYPG